MALPTIHCYELGDSGAGAASSVTVNKPTSGSSGPSAKNVASGDLLLVFVGSDDNTSTAQWDDSSNKPTGFTLIKEIGDSTYDCHCAAFWRIADGTEGSSFSITSQSSDDQWAICVLVSGTDETTPVHVTGATTSDPTPIPMSIAQLATTVDDCMIFFVAAYDGGDSGSFTVGGTGWAKLVEHRNRTSQQGASGAVGNKSLATQGNSGAATIQPSTSDGMMGYQFAIAPSTGGTTYQRSAGLDGTGDLNWVARKTGRGVLPLDGTGDLTSAASKTGRRSSPMSGTGVLEGTGKRKVSGASAFDGTGDLNATGVKFGRRSAGLDATGTFSGVAHKTGVGISALSGAGDLAGTAHKNSARTSTMDGTGTLAGAASKKVRRTAAMAGTGTFEGTAFKIGRSGAGLSGTGTFLTAAQKTGVGASAMAGVGDMAAAAKANKAGSSAMAGDGTLAGAATKTARRAAAATATGDLAASSSGKKTGSSGLNGVGTLSVVGSGGGSGTPGEASGASSIHYTGAI